MRLLITILILVLMPTRPLLAKSYLAGPAPEVSIQEAISLANEAAKNSLPDADSYHVVEAGYSYHYGDTRYWLVVFAKPGAGYFFVGVYSKDKVVAGMRRTPKSGQKFVGPNEEEK